MMQGPMPSGREASDGLVWIDRNGKVHVRLGTGNLGNLSHTGMAVIVSEVLGVPVDDMDVTWANTDRDAWTYVTDASRSCHCDGKAAYNAAKDCERQLLALGAKHLGTTEAQLEVRAGVVGRRGGGGGVDFRTLARLATPRTEFRPYWEKVDQNPLFIQATGKTDPKPDMVITSSTETVAKKLLAESGGIVGLGRYVFDLTTNAWGSCFAEVEVDMETGQVGVLRLVVAHEIGRVLYPAGAEAQIHGGALQGLGFAMTEDLVLDPHSRVPVNTSYYEYRPPTSLDYPEIIPILLEAPGASGPFGAKGLGESPIFGPAPAIGNAILNATGVQIPALPYTWDRVYTALKAAGKRQEQRGPGMKLQLDEPRPFKLVSPASVEDAVKLWHERRGEAMYLAGGGDVVDIVKRHLARPAVLIDLKRIPALRGIKANFTAPEEPGFTLGALTTLREVAEDEGVRRYLPCACRSGFTRRHTADPQRRHGWGNLLQENRCPYYRGPWDCYRHGECTATPAMASTASTPFSTAIAATSFVPRISLQ